MEPEISIQCSQNLHIESYNRNQSTSLNIVSLNNILISHCFRFSVKKLHAFLILFMDAIWPRFNRPNNIKCRSQWVRGLRHGMYPPAQALGSWVRIPLDAWMSDCNFLVFVLSCVSSGFRTGWSPVQGVLPTVFKIRNFRTNSEWEQARA
jgi:hypothetical protein